MYDQIYTRTFKVHLWVQWLTCAPAIALALLLNVILYVFLQQADDPLILFLATVGLPIFSNLAERFAKIALSGSDSTGSAIKPYTRGAITGLRPVVEHILHGFFKGEVKFNMNNSVFAFYKGDNSDLLFGIIVDCLELSKGLPRTLVLYFDPVEILFSEPGNGLRRLLRELRARESKLYVSDDDFRNFENKHWLKYHAINTGGITISRAEV